MTSLVQSIDNLTMFAQKNIVAVTLDPYKVRVLDKYMFFAILLVLNISFYRKFDQLDITRQIERMSYILTNPAQYNRSNVIIYPTNIVYKSKIFVFGINRDSKIDADTTEMYFFDILKDIRRSLRSQSIADKTKDRALTDLLAVMGKYNNRRREIAIVNVLREIEKYNELKNSSFFQDCCDMRKQSLRDANSFTEIFSPYIDTSMQDIMRLISAQMDRSTSELVPILEELLNKSYAQTGVFLNGAQYVSINERESPGFAQ